MSRLYLTLSLALAATAAAADPAPPSPRPGGRSDREHDIILVMDVSGSMLFDTKEGGKTIMGPSDINGIRFDAINLILDSARPEDRVALVLFAGSTAVPTLYIDGSGYVGMNRTYTRDGVAIKGRDFLKQLVKEILDHEESIVKDKEKGKASAAADYLQYNLKKTPTGNTFSLADGTSIIGTLKTIAKADSKLLTDSGSNRAPWLFLFTDGDEDPPEADAFEMAPPHKLKIGGGHHLQFENVEVKTHYDYIRDKKYFIDPDPRSKRRKWKPLVQNLLEGENMRDPEMKPYRDKQVRVITFAIGKQCDKELLQTLADQINPAASKGFGHYAAENVGDVVKELKVAYWGLRDCFVKDLDRKATGDYEEFTSPVTDPWLDMGLLLYRKKKTDNGEETVIVAPEDGQVVVSAVRPGENGPATVDLKDFRPRKSRSHWYYYLAPETEEDKVLRAKLKGAAVNLSVRKAESADFVCTAILRTPTPLFAAQHPAYDSAYSPLDAVPFEVEFKPDPSHEDFQATQFVVWASLTRLSGEMKEVAKIQLKQEGARFLGEYVFHRDPQNRDNSLPGKYAVDIEITGSGPGPLQGFRFRLPRSLIRVTDYPNVNLSSDKLVVSPDDKGFFRARLGVTLANVGNKELLVGRDKSRVMATLRAEFVGAAALAGKGPTKLEASKFKLEKEIRLPGGEFKGAILELPATAVSRIPADIYTGGQIEVRVPWKTEAFSIPVTVRKDRWKLELVDPAKGLTLDFSGPGAEPVSAKLLARLKTSLPVEEDVWLSKSGSADNPPERSIQIPLAGSKPNVTLTIDGLEAAVATPKGGKTIDLRVPRPEGLADGSWDGKIYLVGPAVEPLPIPISLVRGLWKLVLPKGQKVLVDFSDRNKMEERVSLPARLDTVGPGKAVVRLGDEKTKDAAHEGAKRLPVRFEGGDSANPVEAVVELLGEDAVEPSGRPLTLVLKRPKVLPPDTTWKGKLYLVGKDVVPLEIPLEVCRNRWKLEADPELTVNVASRAGSASTRPTIGVGLRDAPPGVTENVEWRLSKEWSGTKVGDGELLKFSRRGPGGAATLRVPVKGLGNPITAGADRGSGELCLAEVHGELPAGEYVCELYLAGEGVESRPVTLRLRVDQPVVCLEDDPEPIQKLSALAPAGRDLKWSFRLRTELEKESSPAQYAAFAEVLKNIPLKRKDGGDELPIAVVSGADRLLLQLKVPASVREGEFVGQLRLDLNRAKAGAAAVLVELPLHLHVAHFAARLAKSELRLEPVKASGANPAPPRAEGKVRLRKAPSEKAVRWWVEHLPADPKDGIFKPLDAGHLDVLMNDKSVMKQGGRPNGPSNPLGPNESIELTVRATNYADLPPGWYAARLRFHSEAADLAQVVEGYPDDLRVVVLVKGLVVGEPEFGKAYQFMKPGEFSVVVTAYDCEPGDGYVYERRDNDKQKRHNPCKLGSPTELGAPKELGTAGQAVRHFKYKVPVRPWQAGHNPFVVSWDWFTEQNEAEHAERQVDVDAEGEITVTPQLAATGETVVVHAVVDPGSVPPGGLTLNVVPPRTKEFSLQLHPVERKGYLEETCKLDEAGVYTISKPPNGKDEIPQTAKAEAVFAVREGVKDADMLYGCGKIGRAILFWRNDIDHVQIQHVLDLENKGETDCRYTARLRFPSDGGVGRSIIEPKGLDRLDPPANLREADAESPLDVKLLVDGQEKAVAEGKIKAGRSLELGVAGEIAAAVRQQAGEGSGSWSRVNGMYVEVTLQWDGKEEKRTIAVPLVVQTKHGGLQGGVAACLYVAVLGLAGFGAHRWWVNGGRTWFQRLYGSNSGGQPPGPDDPDMPVSGTHASTDATSVPRQPGPVESPGHREEELPPGW